MTPDTVHVMCPCGTTFARARADVWKRKCLKCYLSTKNANRDALAEWGEQARNARPAPPPPSWRVQSAPMWPEWNADRATEPAPRPAPLSKPSQDAPAPEEARPAPDATAQLQEEIARLRAESARHRDRADRATEDAESQRRVAERAAGDVRQLERSLIVAQAARTAATAENLDLRIRIGTLEAEVTRLRRAGAKPGKPANLSRADWRKVALLLHPDRGSALITEAGRAQADEVMQLLNGLRDTLDKAG